MTDSRALLAALLVLLAGCSVTPGADFDTRTTTTTTATTATQTTATPTTTAPTTTTAGGDEWTVTVVEVVDGDTLKVEFPDGSSENVRLLGVDTPEVHVETDPPEFEGVPDTDSGHDWLRDWGHRASEFARAELLDEDVTVRTDPAADRRGDFGRLLVYVERDGTDFNRALIEQGYARHYESTFTRSDAYANAEATARENGVGLWGYAGNRTTTRTTGTGTTTAGTTTGTTPAETTTPVPDGGQPPLAVVEIHADAAGNDNENLDDEYVVFENVGDEPLDLSGWRVRDAANHTYEFPDGFGLDPGERVTLHTGSGTDGSGDLYWGSGGAVWNNAGDTIVVLDSNGERVLVREY